MIALIALAAAVHPAVQAERDFAAMAQARGQWTAFRANAADDGIMFVPQAVKAQDWLRDRKDPPVALDWAPNQVWISCDGNTAVTTGPWRSKGSKAFGYFATVWQKQADGAWKWRVDHGDRLETPRPAIRGVRVRRASCTGVPKKAVAAPIEGVSQSGTGQSQDGTLSWAWAEFADRASVMTVALWNGSASVTVLDDSIAAPKP